MQTWLSMSETQTVKKQLEFLWKTEPQLVASSSSSTSTMVTVVFCLMLALLCTFFSYLHSGIAPLPWPHRPAKTEVPGSNTAGCNLGQGSWVYDESYPLYSSKSCPFIDPGFRCQENGRPDDLYTKWRWQPSQCALPTFNATQMLGILRNRRVVFVGDSIGRNQWQSLLCMLAQAQADDYYYDESIYEENGYSMSKHRGFLSFRFRRFNCTVEYYRAPFLVLQSRPPSASPSHVLSTLKLDVMDWESPRWKDAHVLVFNTGHWWNFRRTVRLGCYFQEGGHVNMSMDVVSAFERAVNTLARWIREHADRNKTQIFFRSYAPVHLRHEKVKSSRHCNLEVMPATTKNKMGIDDRSPLVTNSIVWKALAGIVQIINITELTQLRKDGHSSLYYVAGAASSRRQDCSHWCLPGVPDTWNQILYALLLSNS